MVGLKTRGAAALTALAIIALLIVVIIAVSVVISVKNKRARDSERHKHLQTIAQAQEFYFDKFKKYAEADRLASSDYLTKLPTDPATGKVYEIYLNYLSDEWCAWAKSEANNIFFTQDEHSTGTTNQQPTNLASCKD
ncbi:MAG: hypothetical protein ABIJ81_01100 [Patescibacteria group bacterium]